MTDGQARSTTLLSRPLALSAFSTSSPSRIAPPLQHAAVFGVEAADDPHPEALARRGGRAVLRADLVQEALDLAHANADVLALELHVQLLGLGGEPELDGARDHLGKARIRLQARDEPVSSRSVAVTPGTRSETASCTTLSSPSAGSTCETYSMKVRFGPTTSTRLRAFFSRSV